MKTVPLYKVRRLIKALRDASKTVILRSNIIDNYVITSEAFEGIPYEISGKWFILLSAEGLPQLGSHGPFDTEEETKNVWNDYIIKYPTR